MRKFKDRYISFEPLAFRHDELVHSLPWRRSFPLACCTKSWCYEQDLLLRHYFESLHCQVFFHICFQVIVLIFYPASGLVLDFSSFLGQVATRPLRTPGARSDVRKFKDRYISFEPLAFRHDELVHSLPWRRSFPLACCTKSWCYEQDLLLRHYFESLHCQVFFHICFQVIVLIFYPASGLVLDFSSFLGQVATRPLRTPGARSDVRKFKDRYIIYIYIYRERERECVM